MRVLIVGGAGFIGTALAQHLLAHGFEPTVLDTAPRLERAGEWLRGVPVGTFDFAGERAQRGLLDGADALVHLACTTSPATSMGTMARDAETNIAPSVRLFDAAAEAGIGRVVFASSGGTVYGVPARLPVAEHDATRPISAYGVSKLAIEHYLSLYPALGGISLRVANPYGPYQLRGTAVGVIARCLRSVRDGEPIEVWGDGKVVRDFVAIEDVVDAFRLALATPSLAPGAYNVGSGIGHSINDVLGVIARTVPREAVVRYLPARSFDVPGIRLDSTKFSSGTRWTPTIPLEEGIERLWRAADPPGRA